MTLIKTILQTVLLFLVLTLATWQSSIPLVYAQPIDLSDNPADNGMELYLELVINHFPTTHIAAIDYIPPNFYILPEDLAITGIDAKHWQRLTPRDDGKIAINQITDLQAVYQQENQQLLLSVPAAWLPNQVLSLLNDAQTYYPAQNSSGILFNYDTYLSRPKNGDAYTAVWTDLRIFSDYGTIQSTGSYWHQFNQHANRYLRYDTSWQYSDQENMLTFETGDFVTRTLSWSNPVRLGGLQISQNFAIRPDIITYPLPSLSGENNLPSTVDLLVNGYNVESSSLNSGPFTLNNVPFINGAGEATIVTTDVLGRQVSTTVPLYVTSSLLKKGLVDYSLSAGFIRQKYTVENFRYNQLAMSGNYRYGLTNYLTAESHIEATKDLQQLGLGATLKLGVYGVLNGSYAKSYYDNYRDKKFSLGYQYNHRMFNVAMQYNQFGEHFYGLSNLEYKNQTVKSNQQVTFGLPLGYAGNLVAGYFKITSQSGASNELLNLSWNRSFDQFGNLFLSVSKSNTHDNWTGFLQWMVPLSHGQDAVSITTNRDNQKQYSQRINYNHSQPYNGGWGGNLSYQNTPHTDNYYQADIAWSNPQIELYGGTYGTKQDNTWWANAIGSFIFMDQQLYAANSVLDSFVAVTTDSIPNVDIYYENNYVGKTDKNGYLLITKIPAYYAAKYSIDPFTLAENIRIEPYEQRIAVKSKNGYVLKFAAKTITPTYLMLVDEHQQALPLGSEVILNGDLATTYVGFDGFVYFDHIEQNNQLIVNSPQQTKYRCAFSTGAIQPDNATLVHTLICQQE